MASVFKRGLEPHTRHLRCNFSPSGTDTGRLSSQQNVYNRGTNAQNLTNSARQVISAPDGYCILNFDKKTAESIAVGFISGCRAYIDACLSGDVHTSAARLVWPQLDWTGDLRHDKKLAESPFYRMFTYRDMAKRGGHGTNYYGTPPTMASHLKVDTKFVADFQDAYFAAFPEISEWHLRVIAAIQQTGVLTNALGRERRFWGRSDDASVHRSAIAFEPQSLVADEMNLSLIQAQEFLLKECRDAKTYRASARDRRLYPLRANLRAQVHDAGVFIVPIEAVNELAPKIQAQLIHPVDYGDLGVMRIPTDCLIGKTWCKQPKPTASATRWERLGLRDFKPGMDLSFLRS
jgi:DNA polymerase I - 3''-5'' exonuclease and polymerase domains